MYDALVSVHFKDYDQARRDAEKMLRSPDHHKLASSIIELLDAKTAQVPSHQGAGMDGSSVPFRKPGREEVKSCP
jgi:hypothetical protein